MAKVSDPGAGELRAERRKSRHIFWMAGLFSVFANLLMLTGPIYMLQVYDRVLKSGSVATLVALTVLVGFLYGIMAILDHVRGRLMALAGARFQAALERRVFDATLRQAMRHPADRVPDGLQDLEAVQRMMSSPVTLAGFDMPWVPVFLLGIALFHPWLGYLALAGGAALVCLAVLNQFATRACLGQARQAQASVDAMAHQIRVDAEMMQVLGLRETVFNRWQKARGEGLIRFLRLADMNGRFGAASRALRLFLQSAMLGLGAFLAIRGDVSPGAMIAASILLGRALSPVEQALGGWPLVQRAMRAWADLARLLTENPPEEARTLLPQPRGHLEVQNLTVLPPGAVQPTLRSLNLTVEPGQVVGVIGPSGAGKSTLARALTGAWPPAAGHIRLAGAALDHYGVAALGRHIGYLPQRVRFFDGTIAENIARLALHSDPAQVEKAARRAAAHEMILQLPDGYDTRLSGAFTRLSGGQIQRIGLARALYGDPVILILDEPNASLDNEGSLALNDAIRSLKANGTSVVIMAHRPAALQECDSLLVLDAGNPVAFGPRDAVLRQVLRNHDAVQTGLARGVAGGLR